VTQTLDESAPAPLLAEHTVRTLDVKRMYKIGGEEVHALKGVTISISRGEYISIMGPSGSGKSTLFNMIGGLDKPSEGKVYIDEVDIAQLDAYELAWMRCHKIGYIFQTFNCCRRRPRWRTSCSR
jgi:putative ABC transport system ATP-binding protein